MDKDWIYTRQLGWTELDEDGNERLAVVSVIQFPMGFCVFRSGRSIELIHWSLDREDALDTACEASRQEISAHELRQCQSE